VRQDPSDPAKGLGRKEAMNPYYSTDHDLLFYPILKNGSSGYRVALEKYGFVKFLGYDDFTDTVAFTLLREPVRRYFSAVAQMYRSYILPIHGTDWDEYIMAVAAIIRATGKPWRFENDPHFLRQADTVAEMPENQRLFLLSSTPSMH
jgi:hypothetical protein